MALSPNGERSDHDLLPDELVGDGARLDHGLLAPEPQPHAHSLDRCRQRHATRASWALQRMRAVPARGRRAPHPRRSAVRYMGGQEPALHRQHVLRMAWRVGWGGEVTGEVKGGGELTGLQECQIFLEQRPKLAQDSWRVDK